MRLILSIWPLLLAAALLLGGNGLQGTALAVRGVAEEFSPTVIGLIFSVYAFGFIIGCRYAPYFVATAGHIRAFVAFASIASASALAHAIFVEAWVWLFLRLVSGFSFAAMQMVMESWLNEAASNERRGRVLSVYRVTDLAAVTLAQFSLVFFAPQSFVVFAVVSILFSIALVPVALTRVEAPAIPTMIKLDIKRLWRVSPAAVAGCVVMGLTGSAFWPMMPLFVARNGLDPDLVGVLVGAVILGGAVAQFPLGALSDRMDRRYVQIGCAVAAALGAMAVTIIVGQSTAGLIAAAAIFGAFALPNFGIAIAHANDHAAPGTALSVSGGLLLIHGVASITGPLIASGLIALFGIGVLYVYIAIANLLLAAFGAFRLTQRAAPTETEPYQPVAGPAPAAAEIEGLRDEEDDPELPFGTDGAEAR